MTKTVDTYVAPLVRTNNFSGVILIAKGDEIVFAKGYGMADVENSSPNTPETVFHVASVSKPFTAAAIMRLVEQGALDLKTPLTEVLPDYPNGDRITVHHLLTHTSGIPNINSFPEYETMQWTRHTLAQIVAVFAGKALEFEPGTRYGYSNSNYNLLAFIIEKVSGKTYGEFLADEIFEPLGLEKAGHPRNMTEIIPGIADGYAPEGTTDLVRARYLDWSVKTGNGSLYMGAGDLHKFFRAIHQERLLDKNSLDVSFTEHTPNVGYGWFITEANQRRIHHINGRSPGWSAQADYYLDDGVTVIVLSNLYISVTTTMARAVGAIYYGESFAELPQLSAQAPAKAETRRLLGAYQFGPDYYVPDQKLTIVERNGHIFSEYDSGYPASAFVPIDATSFIVRPFWVKAEFKGDADGKATELWIDDQYLARRVE